MALKEPQFAIELFKDQTLGIGSYGKVCKAKYGSLPCAAKLIHETLFHPDNFKLVAPEKEHRLPFKRFEQECEVLQNLRHPNVIQYLFMYKEPDTNFSVLLMELMDGSLTHYLEAPSLQQVPFHIQVNFCHDIALALSFLHANKVIHRDLSSNNVLLISNIRAKVTDFGMATLHIREQATRLTRTMCPGTDAYMPPEAVQDKPVYTEKIDCFSLGVLVIQILTKMFPDPGDRQEEMKLDHPGIPKGRKVMVTIPEVERRENHISLIDPNHPLLAIAFDCLKDAESDRPSAQQICERVAALKESAKYTESIEEAEHKLLQLNELICLKDGALAAKENEIKELKEVNKNLSTKVGELEGTVTKLLQDLEKERETVQRREVEKDASEQEVREIMEHLSMENQNLSSKVKIQKEQIDRLEEKNENIRKENTELHNKYIEKVKEFTVRIDALKVAKLAAESRREMAECPVAKIGGLQDFTAPLKASKKKRQLPIAPRSRDRATSQDEPENDMMFLGATPANRPDSPEYGGAHQANQFDPNYQSFFHEEQLQEQAAIDEDEGRTTSPEEDPVIRQFGEEVANEENLFAELQTASGIDQIITENEKLITEKNELSGQVEELLLQLRDSQSNAELSESSLTALKEENKTLNTKVIELEGTVKKLNQDLEEEREKETAVGADGLTRIEVARVLRERNEYKEKYLSLLEQIRMSDELSLFKSKPKKSRWVDYFAALFSPAKRRQMETQDSTPRRPPILGRHSPGRELDEVDRGVPLARAAGYCNTGVIPVLRKSGRKQDELYMTSVSWVIPALMDHHGASSSGPAGSPNINTCRPMGCQEDGAKVLCAAAVNPVMFLEDNRNAVAVLKNLSPVPDAKPDNFSTSLVWVVSGAASLTKVSVIDAAAMGEALDTFTVCASPIHCIATVPGFNENDPDVLTSLSTARKKSVSVEVRPSSKFATMWMGSESGELYVHSAVSMWKKCIHADKLPAAIQDVIYMKGKVFIFLGNANLAVFRRFPDGDWDWYNYSLVVLETSQRRDFKCTCLAAVHFNVWCAIGNMIHVVHSHLLKKESTFSVHASKKAEVSHMVPVGDGVWISFKFDSTLRLFHGTTLTCMQDLDIGPSVQRVLAFGNERHMPIQVSTLIPAHNALWVGTENGVLLSFPFTVPTMVAEEAGWEFIKEAEVGGSSVPEPFDVRTEHAVEARALNFDEAAEVGTELGVPNGGGKKSGRSSESPLPPSAGRAAATRQRHQPQEQLKQMEAADVPKKMFNPFCSVDGMQLSIHCHINAVKTLVCAPGQVAKDPSIFEPLGGVMIGSEDKAQMKPALFVISCGEGHLDLRTADKVMQTLLAKDVGESGLPSPATIISEKNYIIVWEISS